MKKKQKTQYLQGIADMIQGVESSPFLLAGIEALHDHCVGLNAFGCSISRPDMSQSNCCQVSCFTSNWFLGQRNLPWTSIRLYSSTNPSDSQSKALILSQRFPQKRYRALRLGSIWSWSSTIAHSPSMDFRISVLPRYRFHRRLWYPLTFQLLHNAKRLSQKLRICSIWYC